MVSGHPWLYSKRSGVGSHSDQASFKTKKLCLIRQMDLEEDRTPDHPFFPFQADAIIQILHEGHLLREDRPPAESGDVKTHQRS